MTAAAALLPTLPIAVLLASVFAGALVSSFAGFAFSPVAGVALLYFFPHSTVIPLLMLCSVLVQLVTLIYLRGSLDLKNLGPMLLGGACGVSLATFLFEGIDGSTFHVGFGLFLATYSAVMLWRPHNLLKGVLSGPQQGAVGFLGGVVGGFTAMPGAIPVIYCDLRGVSKEVQRATVQPFILGMQVLALSLFVAHGDIGREVVIHLVFALPALIAGIVIGLVMFGRVPEAQFRRVLLVLLFVTGVAMAA
jgi:uncharacterized membrane protein YfcA